MERNNFFFIFILLLLTSINVNALSDTDINQYDSDNVDAVYLDRIGQTITLSNLHRDSLDGVELYIRKYGTPGTGTVRIYRTSGGVPSTQIDSATFSASSVGASCGWLWVTTSTDLTPYPDDSVYAFSVEGAAAGYEICDDGSNPYAGGKMYIYSGGSWSSYNSYDLAFTTTYNYNNHLGTAATITSPTNGATNVSLTPTINWSAASDSSDTVPDTPYRYQVGNGGFVSVYDGCGWTTGLTCTISSGLTYNTTYTIIVQGQDYWDTVQGTGGFINSASFTFTTMQAPANPAGSISNLNVTGLGTTWISWNWTNPITNYSHLMVYKNGGWVANVSNSTNTVNFINLDPNTNYTIGTRTVSVSGDINSTWVNRTQKTSFECPVGSVCQLNATTMTVLDDVGDYAGNVFKIHSANSSKRLKTVDSLQVMLQKWGSPGVACVEIYELEAGVPTNNLGGGCVNEDDVPEIESPLEWVYILVDPVELQDNVEYAFLINTEGIGGDYVLSKTNNTWPPYGSMIYNYGAGWVTDSNQEVSYIMSYTEETIPTGQVIWDQSSYYFGQTGHYELNISDPSYWLYDYEIRIKYPNLTQAALIDVNEGWSMPVGLSYNNFTVVGNWTVSLHECWLGACWLWEGLLGSDTTEVIYTNTTGTVQFFNETCEINSSCPANASLNLPLWSNNTYGIYIYDPGMNQVGLIEILEEDPDPLNLTNFNFSYVGFWNLTLFEFPGGSHPGRRYLWSDTVNVTNVTYTLILLNSAPSVNLTTYEASNGTQVFSVRYNLISNISFYVDGVLKNTSISYPAATNLSYSASKSLYSPGNYTINATACSNQSVNACLSHEWNWTVLASPVYYLTGYANAGGLPLENVSIDIFGGSSTMTDAWGYYEFQLVNGSYFIEASKTGYTGDSDTIVVNGYDLEYQNFTLVVIPPVTPTPTGTPIYSYNDSKSITGNNTTSQWFLLSVWLWLFGILFMFIRSFNDKG